jgi:hypothetical protein
MRLSLTRLALVVAVPATIAAGCGSSGKATTKATHKSDPAATTTTQYHAGQHCQSSQSIVYASKGLVCVNGTLRHKSSSAPKTKTDKSHTTTAGPQGY